MAENYYNSTLTAAQIEAVLAGVNGVTGLVKRKADGTFEEGSEVYWATYGVSTNAEIETAYQAGRLVACRYSSKIYYLSSRDYSTPTHTFAALLTTNIDYISVTSNVWSAERKSLQLTSGKVITLSEQSTDAQYPSAKCVYGALLLKADAADLTAHTEATDNPHAVTKAQVGLGSVDNTADADKPVSTAQQTALDLKAPLESPALTGMPTAPTAAEGTDNTQIATTAFAKAVAESKAADIEVPLADGDVAAIGISSKFARADHVHPRENLFLIDSITSSKYEISVENGRLRYEEV